MKKEKDAVLIILCVVFSVFLCGLFIGRATARYPVDLSKTADALQGTVSNSSDLFIGKRMNINVATAEDLTLIPSIGKETAQNIIDYRAEHGAFQSLSELRDVEGLGSDRILQIIDYITIGGTYEDIGR